ncbi:MAG: acyl-CoA/acyl-ACP dehydrogenase [Hyphomicrobiales bacterium]|nr:acyl-CoA/acyl-ACP dehydrogenase [Hyphomicrobiales bacterium]MCP5374098.1 acyl-CoA/acyl-ACP dehydrogenase [Hyphomicrobiales bacterium]
MNFELSDEQKMVADAIAAIMARFDDAYWLEKDRVGGFPRDFYDEIVRTGFLGIALPEDLGGAGFGISEAAVMMMTIANSGGGMSAASAIHMNVFSPLVIKVFGTDAQRAEWLPRIIDGRDQVCFGVTEPDAGLNTAKIRTRAVWQGDHWLANGRKVWTSTAQVANKVLLLARTSEPAAGAAATDGLSLFYTDVDRNRIAVSEIEKMGRKAVDSNEFAIDDLPIPPGHLVGEEGKGFRYLLKSLNAERILLAHEAVGIGRNALDRAARYARERVVFDRPIGQNQSIQHPLAKNWVELEAAFLLGQKAAWLYDSGAPCGAESNAAKYFAAEAGYDACLQAVMTHGGMGYAKEFHVERLLREIMITKLAPVSAQMVLCFIAEHVLGMPKSY